MRLLGDLQISPRTVIYLRALGHDVVRVGDVLPVTAPDEAIVATALLDRRTILTQDLDFTSIVALSRKPAPSVVSIRLSSSRVDIVNAALCAALPAVEPDLEAGALVTIEEPTASEADHSRYAEAFPAFRQALDQGSIRRDSRI